jgi:CheY-like chemotaxis protein
VEKFEASESGRYDGILMDMQMPVMNGLKATRVIRNLNHPKAQTIPVIALTANAYEIDIQKSLEAGMNAHLAKPIQAEVVIQTLSKFIDKK